MSKPDEFPADAWDAAAKWAHDLREWADHGNTLAVYRDHDENAFTDTIARAILAERERCAQCAEEVGKAYAEDEAGWLDCSETIAASIRKGTTP